jgi:hypothetical protein
MFYCTIIKGDTIIPLKLRLRGIDFSLQYILKLRGIGSRLYSVEAKVDSA